MKVYLLLLRQKYHKEFSPFAVFKRRKDAEKVHPHTHRQIVPLELYEEWDG